MTTTMQRTKARTLRGWAISVLDEAGAIRECEEHCCAGASVPLLRWPEFVTDQTAVSHSSFRNQLFDGLCRRSVVDAAGSASAQDGYLCVAGRAVPVGMKVAKDYFPPELPTMHAGIYRNVDADDARLDALIGTLAPDEVRLARQN